jgi:hypothetical protein
MISTDLARLFEMPGRSCRCTSTTTGNLANPQIRVSLRWKSLRHELAHTGAPKAALAAGAAGHGRRRADPGSPGRCRRAAAATGATVRLLADQLPSECGPTGGIGAVLRYPGQPGDR